MTRIKTVLGVVAVIAAMLVAFAAPAMADDWDDWNWWDDSNWWNYNADSEWYDDLCSPGLPDGIYVPGCIFSDADNDEDFFFVDDRHDWDWDHHDWDRWDRDRWDWD
jgi:hypothetical protein